MIIPSILLVNQLLLLNLHCNNPLQVVNKGLHQCVRCIQFCFQQRLLLSLIMKVLQGFQLANNKVLAVDIGNCFPMSKVCIRCSARLGNDDIEWGFMQWLGHLVDKVLICLGGYPNDPQELFACLRLDGETKLTPNVKVIRPGNPSLNNMNNSMTTVQFRIAHIAITTLTVLDMLMDDANRIRENVERVSQYGAKMTIHFLNFLQFVLSQFRRLWFVDGVWDDSSGNNRFFTLHRNVASVFDSQNHHLLTLLRL
mmetsp:Transcript_34656/g.84048  ORF Transcript_34656/g.84048 Transcript_34656/m.84048 type:complete len:254 (+) Transcript_34656:4295-5056(+)